MDWDFNQIFLSLVRYDMNCDVLLSPYVHSLLLSFYLMNQKTMSGETLGKTNTFGPFWKLQ